MGLGGTGEGGRPDPGSLPGHDPDRGFYSKDNWKSLKGNKHGNDVITWVLYKKRPLAAALLRYWRGLHDVGNNI